MTYGQRLRWKKGCRDFAGRSWEKKSWLRRLDEGPIRGDTCSFGGSFDQWLFRPKVANLLLSLYALTCPLLVISPYARGPGWVQFSSRSASAHGSGEIFREWITKWGQDSVPLSCEGNIVTCSLNNFIVIRGEVITTTLVTLIQ